MASVGRAALLVGMLGLPALAGLAPAAAFAQAAGPQAAPGDTSASPSSASSASTSSSASSSPPAASASSKPVVPATGYGWTVHPTKRVHVRSRSARAATSESPIGNVVPGFETLADGSSRVFVQLPHPTAYTERAAKGVLTYVLKGVTIDRRNNMNALVTVHFNTPVTSARLVPHGRDVWLVVDLRANVQPTVALDPTKDGGAMLRVEFPKGDYLSEGPSPAPAAPGRAPNGT